MKIEAIFSQALQIISQNHAIISSIAVSIGQASGTGGTFGTSGTGGTSGTSGTWGTSGTFLLILIIDNELNILAIVIYSYEKYMTIFDTTRP